MSRFSLILPENYGTKASDFKREFFGGRWYVHLPEIRKLSNLNLIVDSYVTRDS
jgi:hypothetical protein